MNAADMIAVDTSALAAIAFAEPDYAKFERVLLATRCILISSGTVVETRLVTFRRGGNALVEKIDALLAFSHFEIVPPDREQTDIAHAAFVRYGKGSGHPAQLNFGDLFSYALAKARGVPLLFKGEDFARTDIAAAL